jgi:hypothetical protein
MRRITATVVSFVFLFVGTPAAIADVVSSAEIMQAEQNQYDRQQVLTYIDSDAVQAQLVGLGVDAAAARSRIANMTDAEISTLNAHMQDMPAGGALLNTAMDILIVFLVLDLLGITNVFDFVKPIT